MDHETAVRIDAPTRYYLKELEAPESEAFEEHVAECSACLEDLRDLTIFGANANAILQEGNAAPRVEERRAGRLAWLRLQWRPVLAFSAVANVLLVAGLGYEFSRVTRFEAPRTLPVIAAARAEKGSRSAPVRYSETSILVLFDLPPQHAGAFEYQLFRGNEVVRTGAVSAPAQSEDTLYLDFPTAGLSRGEYRLKVFAAGRESDELGSVVFDVK